MDTLFDAGIQAIVQQGVWCILFIILFMYTMKRNTEREAKYEAILNEQSQSLNRISETMDKMNSKIDVIDDKVSVLEEHEKML